MEFIADDIYSRILSRNRYLMSWHRRGAFTNLTGICECNDTSTSTPTMLENLLEGKEVSTDSLVLHTLLGVIVLLLVVDVCLNCWFFRRSYKTLNKPRVRYERATTEAV